MLLNHLSTKKSCLCFWFPHQTAESNAILEIILSKIFAKLMQVAAFPTWILSEESKPHKLIFLHLCSIFLQSTSQSLAQNKPNQVADKSIQMLLKCLKSRTEIKFRNGF